MLVSRVVSISLVVLLNIVPVFSVEGSRRSTYYYSNIDYQIPNYLSLSEYEAAVNILTVKYGLGTDLKDDWNHYVWYRYYRVISDTHEVEKEYTFPVYDDISREAIDAGIVDFNMFY